MQKFSKAKAAVMATGITVATAGQALAFDTTGLTVDIAPVTALMGIVSTALATLWGYRKFVKTINRC